ncbi:MAG: hypothetical protein ACTSUE_27040, partial [Promethearchaeota archaeon]
NVDGTFTHTIANPNPDLVYFEHPTITTVSSTLKGDTKLHNNPGIDDVNLAVFIQHCSNLYFMGYVSKTHVISSTINLQHIQQPQWKPICDVIPNSLVLDSKCAPQKRHKESPPTPIHDLHNLLTSSSDPTIELNVHLWKEKLGFEQDCTDLLCLLLEHGTFTHTEKLEQSLRTAWQNTQFEIVSSALKKSKAINDV